MPSEPRPSIIPPTGTYQDLPTPYSAVSSFNIPAQCDTSLLTPISASSGSPLLHNIPSKYPHQFPGSPDIPQQQPSPPAHAGMYQWPNMMSDGHSSQSASPLNHAANHEYGEPSYVTDGRRTPGPPPEPYMGAYGVSEGQDYHHNVAPHHGPYYVPQHEHASAQVVDTHMHIDAQRGVAGPHATSARLLGQHNHPVSQLGLRNPGISATFPPSISLGDPTTRPRRRGTQRAQGRGSRSLRTRRNSNRSGRGASSTDVGPSVEEGMNCHGAIVPPTLQDEIPQMERLIFEAIWDNRESRGKEMWERVRSDVQSQTGQYMDKSNLQMKFKRGRRWIKWEDKDVAILAQAWHECQEEYYDWILQRFYENGGSRNMYLNHKDIEYQLVSVHRLEEDLYMSKHDEKGLGVRRRLDINKPKARNRGVTQQQVRGDPSSMQDARTHGLTDEEVWQQIEDRRGSGSEMAGGSSG